MEGTLERIVTACKREMNGCRIKQEAALEAGREKEELYYLGMYTACRYILNTIRQEAALDGKEV